MLIMKIPFLSGLTSRTKRKGAGLSVVLGSDGVHFARVKFVAGRPQVMSYGFREASGMKTSGITPAALGKMRKGLNVGDLFSTTLLAPGEYQLLQVDAPNVPEDELRAAVRWHVKESLTYHVDDATIDVMRIPADQAGGGKSVLYVVAASSELIKRRTELFERAHMNLCVIDIPEMAQRNIAALYEQEGRALALLAFDESGGLLTFSSDGELYLARRIEISLGQLQDANDLLRQQSVDRLELEMQRSMDHFDRQFKHLSVRRLLVSAPESVGLVVRLSNSLDIPVEKLVLGEVMDWEGVPELGSDEAQVAAFYALGAALRQEGRAT